MNVTQTMETLSIQTRDDGLFFELRSLISKNFNKTLAGKGKIISFYDESELPQRKYFLKFLKRIYEKDGQKIKARKLRVENIYLNLASERIDNIVLKPPRAAEGADNGETPF